MNLGSMARHRAISVRFAGELQDRCYVVLHAHLAEHARLLGQIAHAGACTLVHGEIGDLLVIQVYVAFIGSYKACGHIE